MAAGWCEEGGCVWFMDWRVSLVSDPSGAREVCVSAVAAVKQTVCCCGLTPCSEVGSGGDSCWGTVQIDTYRYQLKYMFSN